MALLFIALFVLTGRVEAVPGRTPADFLYELALEYVQSGQEGEAIHELHKLLLIDPNHQQAQQQLALLERKRNAARDQAIDEAFGRLGRQPTEPRGQIPMIGREVAIEEALRQASRRTPGALPLAPAPAPASAQPAYPVPPLPTWPSTSMPNEEPLAQPPPEAAGGGYGPIKRLNERIAPLKVSGEVRSTVGIRRDDLVLDEANGDLNERNFRIFSGPDRFNTFDPRIFSRLRVNVDTNETTRWQLHSNVTVDPWSFVGTTDRITVVGATPTDSVAVKLKWWGPTNTAINEIFPTLKNGDSIATPEIETDDGRTIPTVVTSTFGNTFRIPSLKIDYTFQPVRWLWTGYKNDVVDWRVFPLALEDQALTSDDPLHLSNHHIYWEPSPWLDEWTPGRVNVGATPIDFTRGNWSDDLSFFTRDSDLTRLTALRGTTLKWGLDDTSFQAALASPKGLWEDYSSLPGFLGMARLKQDFLDHRFSVGALHTTRIGYNKSHTDSTNRVYSLDSEFAPWDGVKLEGQGAFSNSSQDRTSNFKNNTRGWTWHSALTVAWLEDHLTSRAFYTHMDKGFDPGLANYFNTRQDQFWSRHLRFKRRPKIWMSLSPSSAVRAEEIEGARIGDGVDIGRDAVGLRLTGSFLDARVQPLFDVRNVHQANGKYVETVWRQEMALKLEKWLTAKTLFLYHDLPKTIAGIDPFVVDADTGQSLANTAIVNGRNPSLTTYSIGAEVAPIEAFSVWAAWEHTNDSTVATGNFPRGLLNSSSFRTFNEDNHVIRTTSPFLFSQGFFPQPPYPFFDIFRAGVYVAPVADQLEFSLDWTRNEFEHAGQIDDNLNHVGLMAAWAPTKRLVLLGRYVASWAIDITRENAGEGAKFAGHHSLYGRLTWKASEDSDLSIEFGEVALGTSLLFSIDPLGDFYPTLDTEHLVRILYSNKF